MILDYFTVLDYAVFSLLLLFMSIIFRNSMLDGMKFYYLMSKIPSDDILESLHKKRKM